MNSIIIGAFAIAALALVVVSAFLIGVKKPRIYTVIPAVFMLVTTIGALIYKSIHFLGSGGSNGIVLAVVSMVLVILAIYISYEAKDVLFFLKNNRKPVKDQHPAWD